MEAARDPREFRSVMQPFIARPIEERLIDLYCNNVARASRAGMKGTSDMCAKQSVAGVIEGLSIPTLILTGTADPLMPEAYVREEVLPYFPNARIVWMPRGHEIPYEMPSETAWLLEAFLSGVGTRSAGSDACAATEGLRS
jgi:pimeloyl-ACP methyl ester carboxylesterase